jgi:hypothetical protein
MYGDSHLSDVVRAIGLAVWLSRSANSFQGVHCYGGDMKLGWTYEKSIKCIRIVVMR